MSPKVGKNGFGVQKWVKMHQTHFLHTLDPFEEIDKKKPF